MSSRVTAILELLSRKRLPWRAVAVGLFASGLCGCHAGMPHSTTWQRVTSPDYMHPEMTLLHGYHRTTWEEWPEHGFRVHYSESRVVEETPRSKAAEPVPSGQRRQELPKPKAKPTAKVKTPTAPPADVAPEPTAEVEAPQASEADAALVEAIAQRQRAEDELYAYREAMARELRRREQIAADEVRREELELPGAIPVEYQVEVAPSVPVADEPVVTTELIALPSDAHDADVEVSVPKVTEHVVEAELLETDAVWAQRFATLIANDRKKLWSELPDDDAAADVCEPAEDELVAFEQVAETPPGPIQSGTTILPIIRPTPSGKVGDGKLQLRTPTESAAAPPPVHGPQAGQAKVRLRVSTTAPSDVTVPSGNAP